MQGRDNHMAQSCLFGPYDDASIRSLPVKVKHLEEYKIIKELSRSSYHKVFLCEKNDGDENKFYYYKENLSGTFISVLESIAADFCDVVRGNAAATYPVVEGECNNYVGVISEEIPYFKSSVDDGMQECDLTITELINENNVPQLELAHNRFLEITDEINRLERCLRKNSKDCDYITKNKLSSSELNILSLAKNETYSLLEQSRADLENFYSELVERHAVLRQDFESYRIVRGHAHAFVMAILNQDADFHGNNFTKYGLLYDFDMCYWILSSMYKVGLIDFSQLNDAVYYLSDESVAKFPNIIEKLRYWVTQNMQFIPELIVTLAKKKILISANLYSKEETELYAKLEKNPVFIYHKYATFLRHLLVTEEIYRDIISKFLHSDEISFYLIESLIDIKNKQLRHMRALLLGLSEFHDFFIKYGRFELNQLIKQYKKNGDFDFIQQINAVFIVLEKEIVGYEVIADDIKDEVGDNEEKDQWCLPRLNFDDIKKLTLSFMSGFIDLRESDGYVKKIFNLFYQPNQVSSVRRFAKGIFNFCEHLLPFDVDEFVESSENLRVCLFEVRLKVSVSVNNMTKLANRFTEDEEKQYKLLISFHEALSTLISKLDTSVELCPDDLDFQVRQRTSFIF